MLAEPGWLTARLLSFFYQRKEIETRFMSRSGSKPSIPQQYRRQIIRQGDYCLNQPKGTYRIVSDVGHDAICSMNLLPDHLLIFFLLSTHTPPTTAPLLLLHLSLHAPGRSATPVLSHKKRLASLSEIDLFVEIRLPRILRLSK